MDLLHGEQGGTQVVFLGVVGEENFNREDTPWNAKNWAFIKVLAELLSLQSSRGDNEPQVWPQLESLLDEAEEDIGAYGSFVRLVQYDDRVLPQ